VAVAGATAGSAHQAGRGDSDRSGTIRSPAFPCATTRCRSGESGVWTHTRLVAGEPLMQEFVYELPRKQPFHALHFGE
jgi:hypothetical protein